MSTSAGNDDDPAVLAVSDLHVEFDTYGGFVSAVRGASFNVRAGKTLGIVGESGCGKSVTVQSILGLIPMPPGRITRGQALLGGVDIIQQKIIDGEDIRGNRVGMIFQDPMSSLNPTMRVGDQIAEAVMIHQRAPRGQALARAVEMLRLVRISDPDQRVRAYPHQLSGGMRQRVMIAMALACNPLLLIADEPTTALDVTVQRQVLGLIKALQADRDTALLFITHDLGVVAKLCHRITVLHGGRVLEQGDVGPVFQAPEHAYTSALMKATPRYDRPGDALQPVPAALTETLNAEALAYDEARDA